MDFQQFRFQAERSQRSALPGRNGMGYWRMLQEMRPDIATRLLDTTACPFDDDSKIPEFWRCVEGIWNFPEETSRRILDLEDAVSNLRHMLQAITSGREILQ